MKKVFLLFLFWSFSSSTPGNCSNWTPESPSKKSNRSHLNLDRTYYAYKKSSRNKKKSATICIFDGKPIPHRLFSQKFHQGTEQKNLSQENEHCTHLTGIIAGIGGPDDDYGVFPDANLKFSPHYRSLRYSKGQIFPSPALGWNILNASCEISDSRFCGFQAFLYPRNDTLLVCAADNKFSPALRTDKHLVRWAEAENMKGYLLIVGNLVITRDNFWPPMNEAFASLTDFSSLHNLVFAPGRDINSTSSLDEFRPHTGTSMATAYVSGVAALLKTLHPKLPMNMIALSIKKGATHKHAPRLGQGALHVDRAHFFASALEDVLKETDPESILKKECALNAIRDYNFVLKYYKNSPRKRILLRNTKSLFAKGVRPKQLLQWEREEYTTRMSFSSPFTGRGLYGRRYGQTSLPKLPFYKEPSSFKKTMSYISRTHYSPLKKRPHAIPPFWLYNFKPHGQNGRI